MKSPLIACLGIVLLLCNLSGFALAQDTGEPTSPDMMPDMMTDARVAARMRKAAPPRITEKDLTPEMLAELTAESIRRAATAPRVAAVAAEAQQTGIAPGRYLATVEKSATFNNQVFLAAGEYQLIFSEGNKVRFARNDFGLWSGSYSLQGARITFTPSNGTYGCTSPGFYVFAVTGNRITFTPIANLTDRCLGRFYAVSSAPFLKSDVADALNDWKNIGPEGGRVFALLQHEGKLFAGLDWLGGVMMSIDNGQTWQHTRGTLGSAIFALAAHNGVLYAGANIGQIFFSTDGGANWEQISGGLLNLPSNLVVFDFVVHNGRLYAGTSNDGVWRMVGNDPYQWERAGTTGLTSTAPITLASLGNTLFAGTSVGLFASTDNGNTWQARNNGRTIAGVRALGVDGNKLYAASQSTNTATMPNAVYLSDDLGQNWTTVGNLGTDLPNQANVLTNLLYFGDKLYAAGGNGLAAFDGTKWSTIYRSPSLGGQMYSIIAAGNTLFAGSSSDGVVRSTDSGATWSNSSSGLKRFIYSAYRGQGFLLAGGLDGIYLSRNEGQSWLRAPMTAGTAAQIFPNIYDFTSFAGKLYAATSGGVYLSTDQGQNWTRSATGIGAGPAYRVLAAGNTLYAAIFNNTSGGLYRSTDEGQTWALAPTSLNSRLVYDVAALGANLFVGTSERGVMRSLDGWQMWEPANTGLPAGPVLSVYAVGSNTLLAAAGNPSLVFRSSDNGQTWTPSQAGIDSTQLWPFIGAGSSIFATPANYDSFVRSTDEGRTWRMLAPPVPGHLANTAHVSGSTLYVAAPTGLFVSNTQANRTAAVSAASFSANAIAEKAIVTAFGTALANSTQAASAVPLPTALAGTTVKVTDAAGVTRNAPLFAVSSGQVNFQIPAGSAVGPANVLITNADLFGARGEITVRSAAPAVFTANGQGNGAAVAIDGITGGGAPFSATQANGQPNVLAVFGSSLGGDVTDGGANASATTTARVGTAAATVLYAGQAPGLVGVNQFNIQLPAGLAAGTHVLTITRGGVTSNSVTIVIR